MNPLSSMTALPLPTFGDDGQEINPAALIKFLRERIGTLKPGSKERASEGQATSFPSPAEFPWETLHEILALTETSLQFFELCIQCVDGLFTGQFALRMTGRLLSLCCSLDVWTYVQTAEEENIPDPWTLREQTFSVLILLLRSVAGNTPAAEKMEEAAWKTLEYIISECLTIASDIMSMCSTLVYPARIQLFQLPRIVQPPSSAEARQLLTLFVERISDVPLVVNLLLTVAAHTLQAPLPSQRLLSGVVARSIILAQQAFTFTSSPSCPTTAQKRVRGLAQIVTAVLPLSTLHQIGEQASFSMANMLVLYCAINDLGSCSPETERLLVAAIRLPMTDRLSCAPHLRQILGELSVRRHGDINSTVASVVATYLELHVHELYLEDIELAMSVISAHYEGATFEKLSASVNGCRPISGKKRRGLHDDSPTPWQHGANELVTQITAPYSMDDMSVDNTTDHQELISATLNRIRECFAHSLHSTSPADRINLAHKLSALVVLLAHESQAQCNGSCPTLTHPLLSMLSSAISRLFDGPDDEVTPLVRVEAYRLLNTILQHGEGPATEAEREHVKQRVERGMMDKSRSVRLATGRVVASIISNGSCLSDSLFEILHQALGTRHDGTRETALLTLGMIGRTAEDETLRKTICGLLLQLGSSNPVTNGVAFMQLRDLAHTRQKTPYTFMLPFMEDVVPLVVTRMVSQADLIHQFCQLISMGQKAFLSSTIRQSVPHIYAKCDLRVLEKMAECLGQSMSTLFLHNVEAVLPHIFLLPSLAKTEGSIGFIVQTLYPDAGSTVPMDQIIKAHVVELLTTLVTTLGADDDDRRSAALRALDRVSALLVQDGELESVDESLDLTSRLLVKNMRGIMNKLTGGLQDFRGVRPIESKRPLLRALDAFITRVGPNVSAVAPQIVASLQGLLTTPELMESTLSTWQTLMSNLKPDDMGPYLGVTTASVVAAWSTLPPPCQDIAKRTIEYLFCDHYHDIEDHLNEAADLSSIPYLRKAQKRLKGSRRSWSTQQILRQIVNRIYSDNSSIAQRALTELKDAIQMKYLDAIRMMAAGDVFDSMISEMMTALLSAASREGDSLETVHTLAFECIGALGALDPDRVDIGIKDTKIIMLSNFDDDEESYAFALHLIQEFLVSIYRSTGDLQYQNFLAYTIQELLKYLQFNTLLEGRTPSARTRKRWQSLPKHVIETISPLLDSGYNYNKQPRPPLQHPIYPSQTTYREWTQLWAEYLIDQVHGSHAYSIFGPLQGVVRSRDAAVAQHILPHIALNILIGGQSSEADMIREEILAVLNDQLDADSQSSVDKKLLSAQAVFGLLEHMNNWVRVARQEIVNKKPDTRRSRTSTITTPLEEQLMRVDSILSSIDRDLLANAALRCRAFALSLMNFEQQILVIKNAAPSPSFVNNQLQEYYERLHEIYANLDEPDGMEGITTMMRTASLEHQIRQHESTGRWTSAQSCWEVRLQQSPDNLEHHLGLIRCLRNLGHYDTLRTHVKGVLTRNPEWEPTLAGFSVESSWMVGDWDDVRTIVKTTKSSSPQVVMADLLLTLHSHDSQAIPDALRKARLILGGPVSSSGAKGYRTAHDAILDLHLVYELEIINDIIKRADAHSHVELTDLAHTLDYRLDSTLPTFRNRERILSMRRTAFAIASVPRLGQEITNSWVNSAKLARKAGYWQTAYSAILQAHQDRNVASQVERAKLVKATGEPLRALQELENSLTLCGVIGQDIIDITMDDQKSQRVKAKAQMLRARWMKETERYEETPLAKIFRSASETDQRWESGYFRYGQFLDESQKMLSPEEKRSRGPTLTYNVIKEYVKAIRTGTKYIYQTVPRLLTLWLDIGEDTSQDKNNMIPKINTAVSEAISTIGPYKWYTAFPQIVSRIGHQNPEVYSILGSMIQLVIHEHPKQALWLFACALKSNETTRKSRGAEILQRIRSKATREVSALIDECNAITGQLLAICQHPLGNPERQALSFKQDFPNLDRLAPTQMIIPLQSSLTATMPPTSSRAADHVPFPGNAPTFHKFVDAIEVMKTLAKPRKITARGSDGISYAFLGKPKDDLRKDARLMDFSAIINKILKATSESRRRQLHIRTYGIIQLNEECGFIQWVPNTTAMRAPLTKYYDARGIALWNGRLKGVFDRLRKAKDQEAIEIFHEEVLSHFPSVFHEWFLETFPEPSAWLASRLTFARTAAVMSMVGFVLGLGDRHSENILLDVNTGDAMHVDFNCLFEKGKLLEVPERVPFRLTHNVVDGLGVAGVEGVFRIACEITIQLLRDNRDTLMSVLDAFIHDPLVDFEEDRRRREKTAQRRGDKNAVKDKNSLKNLARTALKPIEMKLRGIHTPNVHGSSQPSSNRQKEFSTSNLVEVLIQEAMDPVNLAKMYLGWGAYY